MTTNVALPEAFHHMAAGGHHVGIKAIDRIAKYIEIPAWPCKTS
jgi:hypothetical protein